MYEYVHKKPAFVCSGTVQYKFNYNSSQPGADLFVGHAEDGFIAALVINNNLLAFRNVNIKSLKILTIFS